MKITFVRHGETNWNLEGRLQGQTDIPKLTEKGLKQIELAGKKLKENEYDVIICSPLERTIQTAKQIKPNSNMIFDDRLKERSYGNLEGHYSSEKTYDINLLWDYNINYSDNNVETVKDFFKRIYSFLDELIKKDYKSVLLVSHGGVSIALRTYFEKIPLDSNLLELSIDNCEVITYDI